MNGKAVTTRPQASRDIDRAAAHYLKEGGAVTALAFVDALEQAFTHLAVHPATGSPRYATALDLPGLRYWPLQGFPYLIFYVERERHLDVWRVLHAHRDIPAWLQPRSFKQATETREPRTAYRVRSVKAGPRRTDLDNVAEVLAQAEAADLVDSLMAAPARAVAPPRSRGV